MQVQWEWNLIAETNEQVKTGKNGLRSDTIHLLHAIKGCNTTVHLLEAQSDDFKKDCKGEQRLSGKETLTFTEMARRPTEALMSPSSFGLHMEGDTLHRAKPHNCDFVLNPRDMC